MKALRSWWIFCALVLILVFLAIAAPGFFAPAQLLQMLTDRAPVLLVAAGVAMVILTRHIDVSVGAQFAWCSVLAAMAAEQRWPMPAVAGVSLAVGLVLGAINGAFVAGLRLPSIVVTLAMLVTLRDAMHWWREGESVRDLPADFQWWGFSQLSGQLGIIATSAVLFLVLVVALRFVSAGRFIYATGSDEDAARLAGLRPRLVVFGVFTACGGLVGLAALLNALRFTDVAPTAGQGLELQAIAAVVVGGVAISGGRGSLFGVLCGVLLLATIAPALVFLNIPARWERALQGGIILLAVAAEARRTR